MNEVILFNVADGEDKSSPLANKIRKNYKHLKKWAKRTLTDSFRIYDREIREYPVAIDYYAGRICIHFFSNKREGEEPSEELIKEVEDALNIVFGEQLEEIFWRTRKKTKETRQYEKQDTSKEFFTVFEYGTQFLINLKDYLDTGLFLDHRETRQLVAKAAIGKKLLNLFAYTGSFSVQAAKRGAVYTKTVDMSNTYTNWAKKNFKLNDLSLQQNEVEREDCLKFLDQVSAEKYDVIVIDPPTISRSKKMEQLFDVQVDYVNLIKKSQKFLNPGGCIFFSTNSRKFHFDESLFEGLQIREITEKTIPEDFHNQKIHRCWKLAYV